MAERKKAEMSSTFEKQTILNSPLQQVTDDQKERAVKTIRDIAKRDDWDPEEVLTMLGLV